MGSTSSHNPGIIPSHTALKSFTKDIIFYYLHKVEFCLFVVCLGFLRVFFFFFFAKLETKALGEKGACLRFYKQKMAKPGVEPKFFHLQDSDFPTVKAQLC